MRGIEARTGLKNATLVERRDLTPELAVFRIKPDVALFPFKAGQYTVVGIPVPFNSDASCEAIDDASSHRPKLIRRAYSIASSSKRTEFIEIYVTLVRSGELTPRLWELQAGDRLWLGASAKGHFTLDGVPPEVNVVLIGTGTGLAPYMSMIRDHHVCNAGRRFVIIHGARFPEELGYRVELESMARDCQTLVYLPTITRNDPGAEWSGHVGRVQSVVSDGSIDAALGERLSPTSTHVFVSGNPEMVEDVQAMMINKGFSLHKAGSAGSLHVERYW